MPSRPGQLLTAHLSDALSILQGANVQGMRVAVPYITLHGLEPFMEALGTGNLSGSRWLVCLDPKALLLGALEEAALRDLLCRGADLRHMDALHAKMLVVAGEETVIVGSANLTQGGLATNKEAVLLSRDPELVRTARDLFDQWWEQGEPVAEARIKARFWSPMLREPRNAFEALAVMSLLGAFVDIRLSSQRLGWEKSIDWAEIGIPKPDDGEAVSVGKPSVTTLPLSIRRLVKNARGRLDRTLDALAKRGCAVRVEGEYFVCADKLDAVRGRLAQENERLRAAVDSLSEEEVEAHWTAVRQQLRGWALQLADRLGESAEWATNLAMRLTEDLRGSAKFPAGVEFRLRLWLPSPLQPDVMQKARLILSNLTRSQGQRPLPGMC